MASCAVPHLMSYHVLYLQSHCLKCNVHLQIVLLHVAILAIRIPVLILASSELNPSKSKSIHLFVTGAGLNQSPILTVRIPASRASDPNQDPDFIPSLAVQGSQEASVPFP